ncbi:MAG: DUF5110 domain-containing protein, partial [Bacteroidales bacterium]|nr:DUF5110 domain-containing protein [Bacteroidales bacterium]
IRSFNTKTIIKLVEQETNSSLALEYAFTHDAITRKHVVNIYEDDGETNNYKKDIYAIRSIICISNKDNYEINYSERVENGFKLLNRDLIYKIYLDNLPSKVLISDKKLKRGKFIIDKHLNQPNLQKASWSWDEVNNACIIIVPFNQASHKITIEK